MADLRKTTNGPLPNEKDGYDPSLIPDFDVEFVPQSDIDAFEKALNAPETSPVTALNDWRPIRQRVRRRPFRGGKTSTKKPPKRGKDETREGFVYAILKWPLLAIVFGWIVVLGGFYTATRMYIWAYEHLITWRGQRQRLRRNMQQATSYADWQTAAQELDTYLGNDEWKEVDDYAYYDHKTVRKATDQLRARREQAIRDEANPYPALQDLKSLVEACVKNNFVGVENPRIYSETYYGTKALAQEFIDELYASLSFLVSSPELAPSEKFSLCSHLHTNFGRTALCLSGGASFAYYHFGVVKAFLDADLLPDVITGTSGGALVAALACTRTNAELKKVLVPALAHHMTACADSFRVWALRWWRTGARFDSGEWARHCGWFCRGSMTFREAYERTGRILNVTCVPSDPHSPTILTNYLTAPDCVIWSAVLASAAVPGILNPVVLMKKDKDGSLSPYSFGHKWKDGSLRTDIPLKALNLHFNVNFSIVSQVNPHINLFFFSSRGTVGRPVTHRRGRGWRGGFLGSALEQYLKLDLNKWLKVLRHLELLPRVMGQDWSEVWLQRFDGTVTLWPKSKLADFWHILADPTPQRLGRMIKVGQLSAFPKMVFVGNRIKLERVVEKGLLLGGGGMGRDAKDRRSMHMRGEMMRHTGELGIADGETSEDGEDGEEDGRGSSEEGRRLLGGGLGRRRSGVMEELKRQSQVFFDDDDLEEEEAAMSEEEEAAVEGGGTKVG